MNKIQDDSEKKIRDSKMGSWQSVSPALHYIFVIAGHYPMIMVKIHTN